MPDRIFVIVAVDRDPVPGAFHTEKSAKETIETILKDRIPHYNPTVLNRSED